MSTSPTTAVRSRLWQTDTTSTSATYTGQIGHTYGFYSVATSNVGTVQPTPTGRPGQHGRGARGDECQPFLGTGERGHEGDY